jgi:HdeA/HdeB family
MRLKFLVLIVAISVVPMAVHAQLTINMASITCKQYLDMPPQQSRNFSSWMSGWFSYQTRRTFVDFIVHQQNVAKVKAWCHYHWTASVMSALKATIPPQ